MDKNVESEFKNNEHDKLAVDFSIHEMFVSKTDKKGIIEYGNNVFVRVSGYKETELVGSPHNIIRHPDMPKAVFKLFWSKIKKNEPIIAFVKNRAKDGRYYWVLASAFSNKEGYFSIRIKPTSQLLEKINFLYAEILDIEKEKGVDAGFQKLNDEITKLGFESYEEFMTYALMTELNSKTKILDGVVAHLANPPSDHVLLRIIFEMSKMTSETAYKYSVVNAKLADAVAIQKKFACNANKIEAACQKLDFLSVNMSIAAHKLGQDGSSLNVVSSQFRTYSQQIFEDFSKLKGEIDFLAKNLNRVVTDLYISRMQTEMLAYFLKELFNEYSIKKFDRIKMEIELQKISEILESVNEFFELNKLRQIDFFKKITDANKISNNLKNLLMRLDLIKTGGRLEGGRSVEISNQFKPYIQRMNEFVQEVNNPLLELHKNIDTCAKIFEETIFAHGQISHTMDEIDLMLQSLKKISAQS